MFDSRRKQRFRLTLSLITLAFIGLVAAFIIPVLAPSVDAPARTDVVLVLGPPTDARIQKAAELVDTGQATEGIVSVLANGVLSSDSLKICQHERFTCIHPDPSTTSGEVKMLREYSETHHVSSATVITFRPHISRARFIFKKCFDIPTSFIEAADPLSPGDWLYQIGYQVTSSAKAFFEPCP